MANLLNNKLIFMLSFLCGFDYAQPPESMVAERSRSHLILVNRLLILFCTIKHPVDTVFVCTAAEIGSPKHILEFHAYIAFCRKSIV